MTAKKPDAAPDRGTIRLTVRTVPAHGEMTRYRCGLGPFCREPAIIEVTPEQAELLRADPMLIVE
jgi:hypothetical protein